MRVAKLNLGPPEGLQGNRGFLNKSRVTLDRASELSVRTVQLVGS